MSIAKNVLVIGANSDVAKQCIINYIVQGFYVTAASRNLIELNQFITDNKLDNTRVQTRFFDVTAFQSHQDFYDSIIKPEIVVYAAGFLEDNIKALGNWKNTYQMMNVHYCGAVSIINIIVNDTSSNNLERIIGLSSLSGVRGRKSNFIYGSSKAAFTQYLAGLRQYLFQRNVVVNVIIAGYIRSKMTTGLHLNESLMLEPSFIAKHVTIPSKKFIIVPGFKWKCIYFLLRILPESVVAKLP